MEEEEEKLEKSPQKKESVLIEELLEEEEDEEEKLENSPQKKESVLIEEILDDICEGKERENDYRDSASRDMRERSKTADLQKLPQQKESVIIEELSGKSYDKIKKEEKLNKETIDIVPLSKSLLFEAKLDTKQGKVANEERRNIQIKEDLIENSEETKDDNAKEKDSKERNSDDGKEKDVNEGRIDEIGLIKSVRVFGNQKTGIRDPEDQEVFGMGSGNEVVEKDQDKDDTEPTTRKSFVREKLLSGNPSKEYFVSPDISLINMIGRMGKKGAVAEKLVARQKLETENDGSRDLEEELVVRKILKEFGDEEEEEDSEHLLLGFEHQVGCA